MGKVYCNDPNILKLLYLVKYKKMKVGHAADAMKIARTTAYSMNRILSENGLLKGKTTQKKTKYEAGPIVRAVLDWDEKMFLWFCEQWPDGITYNDFVRSFVVDTYLDEVSNG